MDKVEPVWKNLNVYNCLLILVNNSFVIEEYDEISICTKKNSQKRGYFIHFYYICSLYIQIKHIV